MMKQTPLSFFAALVDKKVKRDLPLSHLALDSRQCVPGSLFFALPGKKVDGHSYLQEVKKRGGVAAVVSDKYSGEDFGLELLKVEDVALALQEMGRKKLLKSRSKVIAITGSMGKTTTKEFTKTLLEGRYKVAASPLSYNTEISTPLSILMADGDEDYLILEMGLSKPGDIALLVSIAPPTLACITTLTSQHTCNFPHGLQGVALEKSALFSHPKTERGIVHLGMPFDDLFFEKGSFPKTSFSLTNPQADFFMDSQEGQLRVHAQGTVIPLGIPTLMRAFMHNLLAAIAIARSVDVSWQEIQKRVLALTFPRMRFERVDKEGILFINDAYNANVESIKLALESLPNPHLGGKKIAVLSEMNALGVESDDGHLTVAEAALPHIDLLLLIGKKASLIENHWKKCHREVYLFDTQQDIVNFLKAKAHPGDVVLLKGARAYALEKILDHF